MKKAHGIIWGIAALTLGIIYGGNALGIFDINIFFKGWWTLFLIIPSAISAITEREKFGSLIVLCVGISLLLAEREVFSFEVAGKIIIAFFLISLGIAVIMKSTSRSKIKKSIDKELKEFDKKGVEPRTHISVFSGEDVSYKDEELKNLKLCAVFGGINLDLRNAVIEDDAIIKAFCLFGGIDILLPNDINVKTSSGFVFGGISDERKDSDKKSSIKDKKIPTIYIDSIGGFGGLELKN